jgi:hypothetical protein
MATVTFTIKVTSAGNATVTRTPAQSKFKSGRDKVRFRATGDPVQKRLAAVKFVSSPFAEFRRGQRLKGIALIQGPFVCTKVGLHHFDCGSIAGGVFSPWGGTNGDDIDVPC